MDRHHTEQRREPRLAPPDFPAGAVSVRAHDGRLWHVLTVRDLSANGISVCVDEPMPVGQPVTLVWRGEQMRAEFSGYTAWCAPAETLPDVADRYPGSQVAGLSLHGLQQLHSLLKG